MPETYLEGDVKFTFLRCSVCGEVYPACATDAGLRAHIAEYTRMREEIRIRPVSAAFLQQAEALKQRNIKRSGQVRILIGSTPKLGAGTNVQDRLIALHHLDCPWKPSDLEQQEGRILRQGNQNDKVKIFRISQFVPLSR